MANLNATFSATLTAAQIVYSDVNPDVNTETHMELVYNEDSINKSIVTILGTRKKARVFRRNFGSYVNDLVFDPMDATTVDRLKQEIVTAITEWEHRVVLKVVSVIPDLENNQYFVAIEYAIPALNNKSASFTFNLSTSG